MHPVLSHMSSTGDPRMERSQLDAQGIKLTMRFERRREAHDSRITHIEAERQINIYRKMMTPERNLQIETKYLPRKGAYQSKRNWKIGEDLHSHRRGRPASVSKRAAKSLIKPFQFGKNDFCIDPQADSWRAVSTRLAAPEQPHLQGDFGWRHGELGCWASPDRQKKGENLPHIQNRCSLNYSKGDQSLESNKRK